MFNNKLFILIVGILIAITLILAAAVGLWVLIDKKSNDTVPGAAATTNVKPAKEPSTTEIKANTVIVKDIQTNLSGNTFISITFAFELENAKTKDDFDNLLDSKVKGTIIEVLNDLTKEQVDGSKGNDLITSTLLNKLNPSLKQGKIKQIYVTNKVAQ